MQKRECNRFLVNRGRGLDYSWLGNIAIGERRTNYQREIWKYSISKEEVGGSPRRRADTSSTPMATISRLILLKIKSFQGHSCRRQTRKRECKAQDFASSEKGKKVEHNYPGGEGEKIVTFWGENSIGRRQSPQLSQPLVYRESCIYNGDEEVAIDLLYRTRE